MGYHARLQVAVGAIAAMALPRDADYAVIGSKRNAIRGLALQKKYTDLLASAANRTRHIFN
jgi:hypothetical protein